MSIGQVTFEAVYFSVHGISADRARSIWNEMTPQQKESWELAGQTVQAYYETGITGSV